MIKLREELAFLDEFYSIAVSARLSDRLVRSTKHLAADQLTARSIELSESIDLPANQVDACTSASRSRF